jgi:hypothetical protein
MTELDLFKKAFDQWAKDTSAEIGKESVWERVACMGGIAETRNLLWPFVEYLINEPEQHIEKIKLFNRFKFALGMELKAHEYVGLELEGQGQIK